MCGVILRDRKGTAAAPVSELCMRAVKGIDSSLVSGLRPASSSPWRASRPLGREFLNNSHALRATHYLVGPSSRLRVPFTRIKKNATVKVAFLF